MKKIILICTLAAATMSVVACRKEAPAQDAVSLEMSIPAQTKVTVSGQTEAETLLSWEATDKLWVRSSKQPGWERGSCFTTTAGGITDGGRKAVFNGTVRTDGRLAAVYPYQLVTEGSDNGQIVLDLEQSYPLKAGSCPDGTVAVASFWSDGAASMVMEYIFGAIQFSVKGNGQLLSEVTLTDSRDTFCLWGKCRVTPDYTAGKIGSVDLSNDSNTRNQVKLTPDSPVALSDKETSFFFTVPQNALQDGFTLRLTFADGATREFVSGPFNNILRGQVTRMPAIDCGNP